MNEQGQKSVHPLIVEISNNTKSEHTVMLLHPRAQKDDNYGNPKGIVLKSPKSEHGDSYEDLLSMIANKNIGVGMIYIQKMNGSLQGSYDLNNIIVVHQELLNGDYHGKRILPIVDPYQNQNSMVVIKCAYSLNNILGVAHMKVTIDSMSTLCLYLYTTEISTDGNKDVTPLPTIANSGGLASLMSASTETKPTVAKRKPVAKKVVKKASVKK